MSCADAFVEQCNSIVHDMDVDRMMTVNNVAIIASRISKKHPFVFLPDFVEDLVSGLPTDKIMFKYRIPTHPDYFNLLHSTLKLKGQRSRGKKDSRTKNLSMRGWQDQYDRIKLGSTAIYDFLVNMTNCNVLTAMVVHSTIKNEYIANKDLDVVVLESYRPIKNHVYLPKKVLSSNSLDEYLQIDLHAKIVHIISNLAKSSRLTYLDDGVSVPENYSKVSDVVYEILDAKRDGMSYQALMSSILKELPLLKLVPGMRVLDSSLANLEGVGKIVYKRSMSKNATASQQLFTHKNYSLLMAKIEKEVFATKIKFFGRQITPDLFVDELRRLDTGDLDDRDDQVTRIAGLVMSDAAVPQSPSDPAGVFDFSVDIEGYQFRPEQLNLIKRLDFIVKSSVFHCKVMINEKITPALIHKIKKAVPKGDQGVLFTCTVMDPATIAYTKLDRVVQIINEDGIREWCAITPTMPCKKNSVALVMYGDSEGKVAMVRSLNYESGLATVTLAPDRVEATLPIGCLKEVGPDTATTGDEFDEVSESFFDLVCTMAEISPDAFDDGIRKCVIPTYKTVKDMLANAYPSMSENQKHKILEEANASLQGRRVAFDDGAYTTVANRGVYALDCTCLHKINSEYRTTLCKHLVSAVAAVASNDPNPAATIDHLNKSIDLLRTNNVRRTASALADIIGPRHAKLLQEYLLARANND